MAGVQGRREAALGGAMIGHGCTDVAGVGVRVGEGAGRQPGRQAKNAQQNWGAQVAK